MAIPSITTLTLAGTPGQPLLLVGPSLGTSAETLWGTVARLVGDRWHVVGWELPGHGRSTETVDTMTMAELAAGVRAAVAAAAGGTPFLYAGDSVGGAVGLQLLLDAPDLVRGAVLCCTSANFSNPTSWGERAALVREQGMQTQLERCRGSWFGPGFLDREPTVAQALLDALVAADPRGYAATCDALSTFDVRDRLAEITAPVLAIAGTDDAATPAVGLKEIADGVRDGRFALLDGVGHLAPGEAPDRVADLLRSTFG